MALDTTFGALLIGVIIASVLYGVTVIQTWYYYDSYPSDPWQTKLLVAAVLVSDTCHQLLITHSIYVYLVTNFGVTEALGKIVWSLIIEVYFNGFTALFVQSFLTLRIYRLSNKSLLATGSALVMVFVEFALILVYCARAVHFTTFKQLTTLKNLSMSVNVAAAVGDLIISVMLCALLQRSRTGFRRSETMINKLIVFSINTGLLTSLCALASLVSILIWPKGFIYVMFYFNIGRLYCNALLATLNARSSLRSGDTINDDTSFTLQTSHQKDSTMLGTTSKRNISIRIDTTHEFGQDEEYAPRHPDLKDLEA